MPVTNSNGSSGSTAEFMEMIKIEIRSEVYVVYMVATANRDGFSGHCRETVVVEFPLWSCNSNTTLDFM